jgi:hypothetical protein
MTKYYDSSLAEINLSPPTAKMDARNIPLDELIEMFDQLLDMTKSPVFLEATTRLSYTRAALTCLHDALFYVRMYKSLDTTGEGERRRQELIDDSESVISLIRTGGLYP